MPASINFNPAAVPLPRLSGANMQQALPLARTLAAVRTEAPSGSVPFSRTRPPQNAPVNVKLPESHRNIATPSTTNGPRLSEKQMRDYKTFCTALGTNAGSRNIAEIMQGKRSALDVGTVMTELEQAHHPEDIQSLKKSGILLKTDMKSLVTKEGLGNIATDIYKSADSSKIPVAVYRGLGMTAQGLKKLIGYKDSATPVHSESFLSCSKDMKVAESYANTYTREDAGEKKVQFQIRGFSNMALRSHLPYSKEEETIFSPHASFEIEKIFKGATTGHYIVRLKEIPADPKAVPLPS